ncbi:unnamed protein product [Protopolystoma xenopodis]|uniref:Uncharacterized protein n=1 Tax=Protopolystoma xenopodis TaxID=117903 RepID=A0A3S5BT30_9PLAT|nr:unnamed protein product [Protopolystoma xenopodis]
MLFTLTPSPSIGQSDSASCPDLPHGPVDPFLIFLVLEARKLPPHRAERRGSDSHDCSLLRRMVRFIDDVGETSENVQVHDQITTVAKDFGQGAFDRYTVTSQALQMSSPVAGVKASPVGRSGAIAGGSGGVSRFSGPMTRIPEFQTTALTSGYLEYPTEGSTTTPTARGGGSFGGGDDFFRGGYGQPIEQRIGSGTFEGTSEFGGHGDEPWPPTVGSGGRRVRGQPRGSRQHHWHQSQQHLVARYR